MSTGNINVNTQGIDLNQGTWWNFSIVFFINLRGCTGLTKILAGYIPEFLRVFKESLPISWDFNLLSWLQYEDSQMWCDREVSLHVDVILLGFFERIRRIRWITKGISVRLLLSTPNHAPFRSYSSSNDCSLDGNRGVPELGVQTAKVFSIYTALVNL